MGSQCNAKTNDNEFDQSCSQCQILPETAIPYVNQTKNTNNFHFQLHKESPQEGIAVSNIQNIVIIPENDQQGVNIMRSLAQTGSKLILIQKKDPQTSPISPQSTTAKFQKGILKNKGSGLKLNTQSSDEMSHFFPSPKNGTLKKTKERKVKII